MLVAATLVSAFMLTAAPEFAASGNCKVECIPNGCKFTAQPGKGWPQVRITVPEDVVWKGGSVEMSIKQVAPAGKFPGGITVGTNTPRSALKAGYITNSMKAGQKVSFKFENVGETAPKELYVSLKNPTAEVVLEITDIKFNNSASVGSAYFTSYTASGNAKAETVKDGVYKLTVQPGKGWPQILFDVPSDLEWKDGFVAVTLKRVSPEGTFPGALSVESVAPANAIKGGYIHGKLAAGKEVTFKFPCVGDKAPRQVRISFKNPTAVAVLEISNIKFVGSVKKNDAVRAKKRLAPIPPVMFKGKPFFPLGAYDMFAIGESGKFGSLDERFIEAGGNFCDFGAVYMPPEFTDLPAYKKAYQTHGQPAIFAALDKMKNDPRFKDVALLVGLSGNVMLDDSEAKVFGMHGYLKPAVGEKLELRKKVLAEAAAKLATYPNVIGYTMDEPENTVWSYYDKNYKKDWAKRKDKGLCEYMVSWINWTQDVIKKHHPKAQMMPIIAWEPSYENTTAMFDVLIANTYPHKLAGKKEFEPDLYRVSYDAAMQVAAVRAAGNGKSAIFMPPMYDLRTGHIGYTVREQMYVMFAPITRGVMGIHGWRLQRCSDEYRKHVIYPAMKEVHNLKEYFLGEWHDELVTSDRDTASVDYLKRFKNRVREVEATEDGVMIEVKDAVPDVTYCLRKHPDGSYLLLAVNNMREPVTVNFVIDLPKLPRFMIDNIDKSCKVWLKGKKAQVKFEPFEVHAFILRP